MAAGEDVPQSMSLRGCASASGFHHSKRAGGQGGPEQWMFDAASNIASSCYGGHGAGAAVEQCWPRKYGGRVEGAEDRMQLRSTVTKLACRDPPWWGQSSGPTQALKML
jgi:hypothetical protein